MELRATLGPDGVLVPTDQFVAVNGLGASSDHHVTVGTPVPQPSARGTVRVTLQFVTSSIGKPVMVGLTRRIVTGVERVALACIVRPFMA